MEDKPAVLRKTSVIALFMLLIAVSTAGDAGCEQWKAKDLTRCQGLELVREHRLGPGRKLFGHVQGLEVTEEFFFLTSIALDRSSGFLYIYPRSGPEGRPAMAEIDVWKLARERASACTPLDDGPLNHPSGLFLEEDRLHVAVARSQNRGPSCIMALAFSDVSHAPQVRQAVRIEDHIGAVIALDGRNLAGFNWATDEYWWVAGGDHPRRLPLREVLRGSTQEYLHIQDCDRQAGRLYCTYSNEVDDLLKVYAPTALGPGGATLTPEVIVLPAFGSRNGGTHEGVAIHDGHLFLLPDDGDETGVSVFELRCANSQPN